MKVFTGRVLATKTPKTATVAVSRFIIDPVYKKRVKKIKTYLVHDEVGVAVGDAVKFVACKPISKLKKWKIVEIMKAEERGGKNK